MVVNKDIVIFGAGISGLTVAHELLERGYNVTIYEKSRTVGGFAKSRRVQDRSGTNGMPTEHSWRGYGPFYGNFFDIAKRIPLKEHESVFDNLSKPIEFVLPNDNIDNSEVTMWDKIYVLYYIAQCLASNKRRKEYSYVNFKELIKNNISKAGRDEYIKRLGPGLGLDQDRTSLLHAAKFVELILDTKPHNHSRRLKYISGQIHPAIHYKHESHEGWHVMTKPTSEAWFDPWVVYLKSLGLKLHFKTELFKYLVSDNNIECAIVSTFNAEESINTFKVGNPSTIYINCTDPFTFKNTILNSFQNESICGSLLKSINLVNEGVDNQIGFSLEFNKKINIPSTTVFSFPDSEFNITLYPQDNFFKNDPYFKKHSNSFWSGCICSANIKGKLFNKPAIELNKTQLLKEVIHQIFRSDELYKFVKKYNSEGPKDLKVVRGSIWNEWKYDDVSKKLISTRPKWVNSLKTHKYRPDQKTNFKNLYIAGAHTKTSINIWSMEGAVESGKIIARHIINDTQKTSSNFKTTSVKIINHGSPWYLIPFQIADDILYTLYLPNIINMLLLICFIIIVKLITNNYSFDS